MFFITCIVLLVAAEDTMNKIRDKRYHHEDIKPTKSTFYGWRHEEGGSYEGGSDQLGEKKIHQMPA